MKKTVVLFFLLLIIAVGCARTWICQPLETYKPTEAVPPASVCQPCHQAQFDSWEKSHHAEAERMVKIPVPELRECGACHDGLAAHAAEPDKRPASVTQMSRTERNTLCGKCHYNQMLFGGDAINPTTGTRCSRTLGSRDGKNRSPVLTAIRATKTVRTCWFVSVPISAISAIRRP
jgi:hypothetical protein